MNWERNNASKRFAAWPARFITDFDYMFKKKHFYCTYHIEKKSIVSEIWRCLKDPYYYGKKLSCELASTRSASIAIIIWQYYTCIYILEEFGTKEVEFKEILWLLSVKPLFYLSQLLGLCETAIVAKPLIKCFFSVTACMNMIFFLSGLVLILSHFSILVLGCGKICFAQNLLVSASSKCNFWIVTLLIQV